MHLTCFGYHDVPYLSVERLSALCWMRVGVLNVRPYGVFRFRLWLSLSLSAFLRDASRFTIPGFVLSVVTLSAIGLVLVYVPSTIVLVVPAYVWVWSTPWMIS